MASDAEVFQIWQAHDHEVIREGRATIVQYLKARSALSSLTHSAACELSRTKRIVGSVYGSFAVH